MGQRKTTMDSNALETAAAIAEKAADAARREILPRFRSVAVETKADGSPVTEADRQAEQAIRSVLREAYPEHALLGEEYGEETKGDSPLRWVIDPIDGTIAFARGIPLFSTLIALMEGDEPILGLIDLPSLNQRYLGWKNGGCRLNGTPVQVSHADDLQRALVSHGDPFCFERAGQSLMFERMAREIPFLRGYTDAFGHAQVLSGGVDVMVDFDLNLWDAAATQVLTKEAGGECRVHEMANGKLGLILGSPSLVRTLSEWLS